jgi:hypothetical protein
MRTISRISTTCQMPMLMVHSPVWRIGVAADRAGTFAETS